MKIIFALTLIIASTSAFDFPKINATALNDERLVVGAVRIAIDNVRQRIKQNGPDPLFIDKKMSSYALPVRRLFNYTGAVDGFLSYGLSNIVINKMSFSVEHLCLSFDIEMPLVHFSVGSASAKIKGFGNGFSLSASGAIEFRNIRVNGQIRFNVGIISGVTVRNADVIFTPGEIESDVEVHMQGVDYSRTVNRFFTATIPDRLTEYRFKINDMLEILLTKHINQSLK